MRVTALILSLICCVGLGRTAQADVECASSAELINETVTISVDLGSEKCFLHKSLSDVNTFTTQAENFVTLSLVVGLERLAFILKESRAQGTFIDPFVLGHDVSNYSGQIEFDTFFVALQDRVPSSAGDDGQGSALAIEIGSGEQRFKLHVIGLRREKGIDKARFTRIAVSEGPFGPLETVDEPDTGATAPEDSSDPDLAVAEPESAAETANDDTAQSASTTVAAASEDESQDVPLEQALWPDLILRPDALPAHRRNGDDEVADTPNSAVNLAVGTADRLAHTLTLGDMLRPNPSVIDPSKALKVSVFAATHSDQIWHDWPQRSDLGGLPPSLYFGRPINELPPMYLGVDGLTLSGPLEPDILRPSGPSDDNSEDDRLEDRTWRGWNDGLPGLGNPRSFLEDHWQLGGPSAPKDTDPEPEGSETSDPDGRKNQRGLLDDIIGGRNSNSD